MEWAEYNALSWRGLHYNLREGRLFADPNVRAAMGLCVDKVETVAAATGGTGVPIYSYITPSMWAFEPDLPRPTRDIDAGRELIEASGWTVGDDGVYRKGQQRLATMVPVIETLEGHLRFVELLAFQVADCGIEIVPQVVTREEMNVALTWPLVPPGGDRPWDAVFAGWGVTPDPDVSAIFHSSAMATATNPGGYNYMGYDSPESDALLEQGRATYDTRCASSHLPGASASPGRGPAGAVCLEPATPRTAERPPGVDPGSPSGWHQHVVVAARNALRALRRTRSA